MFVFCRGFCVGTSGDSVSGLRDSVLGLGIETSGLGIGTLKWGIFGPPSLIRGGLLSQNPHFTTTIIFNDFITTAIIQKLTTSIAIQKPGSQLMLKQSALKCYTFTKSEFTINNYFVSSIYVNFLLGKIFSSIFFTNSFFHKFHCRPCIILW